MRWVESAVPSVGEVEDRYVEHEHWVVHSPTAPEHFSPFVCETSLPNFHSFFLLPKRSLTIHFLSRVHSFPFVVSVVEEEKGKKADQNPEHRAENGEPEWDIPARVGQNECGAAAELFDFCDDVRAFFLTPATEDDFGAGAGEFDGGRLTDAGSSSGHECNFA
jgi:hypothetical protein